MLLPALAELSSDFPFLATAGFVVADCEYAVDAGPTKNRVAMTAKTIVRWRLRDRVLEDFNIGGPWGKVILNK